VNKSKHPARPAVFSVQPGNYSQRQIAEPGGGEQLFGSIASWMCAFKPVRVGGPKQKTTRCGWSLPGEKKPSGGRFAFGRSFGLGFGFGGRLLALQIGIPPFPFLSFIVLLAHNTLYIQDAFRLFSVL
jgi:hypothetical protein